MTFYEAIPHVREASRNDIIEIISERIPLKKSGRYFEACCPFHSEKTASFKVHEIKGTYKCYGCDAWGDAISFVEFYDGLTFNEVIYLLAERYHLSISNKSRKRSQQAIKKKTTYFQDTPPLSLKSSRQRKLS
ncbi:CHC2 zinc finger domain-containing protein [Gracilimonas sediminicola]|uniref:CHC2 zinc finger domain-containing protein n=1 Tax=Gracilimonas sediminicola TaxID=2952158 RepID=UPI0038D3DD9D